MKKILCFSLALLVISCGKQDVAYDASGAFETTEVIVSAKAQGEILSFDIEEGQSVRQGDTLGHIDAVQLWLRRQQLEQSRQANDQRQLNLTDQVAALKQQIANAKKEKERFQGLLQAKAATQKQVDDIAYQISVLERQLQATTEQIRSANTSLQAQGEGIGTQISGVEQQISDATILSPITGIVLTKYAEAGEYATPGRVLLRVANIEDMKLRAYITAEQVTALKIGQKATVYADQGESDRKAYEGTVSWISSEAEFTPKTIQTRDERSNLVYAVKISVKNDGTLKRGMYGEVKFNY